MAGGAVLRLQRIDAGVFREGYGDAKAMQKHSNARRKITAAPPLKTERSSPAPDGCG